MKDYYSILGISENATKNEIKKAYHKTALKYHPDKNKETEKLFKDAVEAYEVLYDDTKRRKYNLSRKLKQDYKFVLPPEIFNFSKYFFSQDNINKFSGSIILSFRKRSSIFGKQRKNIAITIRKRSHK